MASIVLIETNGTVKTLKTKELTADTLYKKCGFRINEDFTCRHTWHVKLAKASKAVTGTEKEKYIISVWAKKTGKAGGENKYDFPPPIDKDLFFGTCAVVRTNTEGAFIDLTKETWLKIYEKLFGGFEDIGDEDEYSEDELENVDPSLLTKNGYLKDGFVVSDKELTSGAPSTEDEEDEVKEQVVTVKKKTTKTKQAKPAQIKEAKQTKQAVKETKPAQAKQVQAKQVQAKQTQKQKEVKETKQKETKQKETKQAPKEAPAKEVSNSESEETTSELEEEVYTFSDDD